MEVEITKKTKDRVIYFLNKYTLTKDIDNLLICYMWQEDLNNLGKDINISTKEFFNIMFKSKLTSSESIRRIRAKLQSEYPHYRGKNYFERANKQTDIKDDILNFDEDEN